MGEFRLMFPCGMWIEGKNWNFYFGTEDFIHLYEKGCPIHGKKCNAIKEK